MQLIFIIIHIALIPNFRINFIWSSDLSGFVKYFQENMITNSNRSINLFV